MIRVKLETTNQGFQMRENVTKIEYVDDCLIIHMGAGQDLFGMVYVTSFDVEPMSAEKDS